MPRDASYAARRPRYAASVTPPPHMMRHVTLKQHALVVKTIAACRYAARRRVSLACCFARDAVARYVNEHTPEFCPSTDAAVAQRGVSAPTQHDKRAVRVRGSAGRPKK